MSEPTILYEARDVALARGVTPSQIAQHARAGLIRETFRTARGTRLYDRREVDAYLAACRARGLRVRG